MLEKKNAKQVQKTHKNIAKIKKNTQKIKLKREIKDEKRVKNCNKKLIKSSKIDDEILNKINEYNTNGKKDF